MLEDIRNPYEGISQGRKDNKCSSEGTCGPICGKKQVGILLQTVTAASPPHSLNPSSAANTQGLRRHSSLVPSHFCSGILLLGPFILNAISAPQQAYIRECPALSQGAPCPVFPKILITLLQQVLPAPL